MAKHTVNSIRRKVAEVRASMIPVRTLGTTGKSKGKEMAWPVFVEVSVKASDLLKKTKLAEDQVAIYVTGFRPLSADYSTAEVVGQTGQKTPMDRLTTGYADRIRCGGKDDSTLTIGQLTLAALESGLPQMYLHADILEICQKREATAREQYWIRELRRRGASLYNENNS